MEARCHTCALAIMCESWDTGPDGEPAMPEPPDLVAGVCPVCGGERPLKAGDCMGFWDAPSGEKSSRRTGGSVEPLVLVVDDDDEFRGLACCGVEGTGCKALGVSNGAEATRVLARLGQRIELVLLDVRMPNMSGPEVFHRLRETKPDVPVVFMSGFREDDVDALTGLDYDDFLLKPFRLRDLREVVARFVVLGKTA